MKFVIMQNHWRSDTCLKVKKGKNLYNNDNNNNILKWLKVRSFHSHVFSALMKIKEVRSTKWRLFFKKEKEWIKKENSKVTIFLFVSMIRQILMWFDNLMKCNNLLGNMVCHLERKRKAIGELDFFLLKVEQWKFREGKDLEHT